MTNCLFRSSAGMWSGHTGGRLIPEVAGDKCAALGGGSGNPQRAWVLQVQCDMRSLKHTLILFFSLVLSIRKTWKD